MTDQELGFQACYDDLVQCRREIKRLKVDRNAVLEGVAELVDEEREKTWSGQPYFVLLAKKIRNMKEEP